METLFLFPEARADISGPSEKYLKPGSPLRLGCTLLQSTEPPVFVFWYHNNRMINYDNDRGVNVSTDLAAKTSSLLIASASPEHTGNYSCVPNNAQPASTFVHILNGEFLIKPNAFPVPQTQSKYLSEPTYILRVLPTLLS